METQKRSRKGIGGPKTPEGRKRVSLNALKHGLTAKSPQALQLMLLNPDAFYSAVHSILGKRLRPANTFECSRVELMAKALAGAMRAAAMERMVRVRLNKESGAVSLKVGKDSNKRLDKKFQKELLALLGKQSRKLKNKLTLN